jgi:hypothetical protein
MWYFTSLCVRDFNLGLHDGLVKNKAFEGIPIDRKVFMLGHHAYPKPLKRRHEPNGTRSDHLYRDRADDCTGLLINFRTNPALQIHKEDLLQEVVIRMCELTGRLGRTPTQNLANIMTEIMLQ